MSQDASVGERRQNTRLRGLFENAYQSIAPFLDPKLTWGGVQLEYLAFRALRETLPGLSSTEVRQLVSASVRVYKERAAAAQAPAPERIIPGSTSLRAARKERAIHHPPSTYPIDSC